MMINPKRFVQVYLGLNVISLRSKYHFGTILIECHSEE